MKFKLAAVACMACIVAGGATLAGAHSPKAPAPALRGAGAFLHVGHDNIVVDPSLRRYTGVVTTLGAPDASGHIYSFRATPIGPGSKAPGPDEMRGWRLTILAGKRFSSVFSVRENTGSEVSVEIRDGPLDGLAAHDVFIVEELAASRPATSGGGS
jgi:hypothetical protein